MSNCHEKRCTKTLDKPSFQKQTFNQAMKIYQSLPNKQVTSNNMNGKPLSFPYHSRSNCSENRDTSRHRSPNRTSNIPSNPYFGNCNFKRLSRMGSPYPRPQNFQSKPNYNNKNNYSNFSRAQSLNFNRD